MVSTEKTLIDYARADFQEAVKAQSSSLKGLGEEEAQRRLKEYGKNLLVEKKELSLITEFLSQFRSPVIVILVVAAVISAFIHETVDAIIILGLVALSVLLNFVLEHRAGKAAERLRQSVKSKAHVIRGGTQADVVSEDICAGDIIVLAAGDLVPADARLITAKDFFINQSSLTGESFPVEKRHDPLTGGSLSLSELNNIIFMGTNVISGSATAIVVKTGQRTEFGKIATKLASAEPETEFERGISGFSFLVMKTTIFLVFFIFMFNAIMKHHLFESFMFAIAIAVGLIPELLPMIMSVNMASGSLKMAEKGAIVKKLNSIPNFGSMDVLCTDKTGTLTQDKIKLVKYTDVIGNDSNAVLEYAYVNSFHETGIKNPLDEAILTFRKIDIRGYSKIDEIPFDFVRKKMSVVVEKGGKRIIVTKGAPEEIFKSSLYYHSCDKKGCGKKMRLTQQAIADITQKYHDFSSQGYRVLAIAIKEIGDKSKTTYSKADESDLEIVGFVSFLDPPKEDAKEVIEALHGIGIEVKVITGDNELVAKKVCDEISLNIKGILLGSEISGMTDDALKIRVENTTIFARFSPDEKNRVISALRSNGHVVGYMGDGINDAPSLRSADIGISVSSAVDIAKESADIILTRKSLHELKDGVLEGRKTFGNTMKYIMMSLSSNFGNMFSVTVAVLFLPFLPMLPIQILLTNFIYDFSQITIPTDNVDDEFIRKPKRWNMKFIQRFMLVFGPISSIFDILVFLLLMVILNLAAPNASTIFQTAWFMESLATQTLVIHIIRTKRIPFIQSTASSPLVLTSLCVVAFGWILPYTPLAVFFKMLPLPMPIFLIMAGLTLAYLVTVEIAKRLFYRKFDF